MASLCDENHLNHVEEGTNVTKKSFKEDVAWQTKWSYYKYYKYPWSNIEARISSSTLSRPVTPDII